MSRRAGRESFDMVAETCPDVDRGAAEAIRFLNDAISGNVSEYIEGFVEGVVKKKTAALRDALIEAITLKNDAVSESERLEQRVNDLEAEVARLTEDLKDAEAQL